MGRGHNNNAMTMLLAGRAGNALEIGSGTGQQTVLLARALPDLIWYPSDTDPRNLTSIEGWRREAARDNLCMAIELNAEVDGWGFGEEGRPPDKGLTAIVAIDFLHHVPWETSLGLLRGAGRYLEPEGLLAIYGPFRIAGRVTANSIAEMEAALSAENTGWGARDSAELIAAAPNFGLSLVRTLDMPDDNVVILFEREP